MRVKCEERVQYSKEDKEFLLLKTRGVCAHCGKKLELDSISEKNNFTVEHIVPLSKGGRNAENNLIGLCYECNQEKGNLVVDPVYWYPYILPEYIEDVSNMFDTYIKEVDYVNKNNLLHVDMVNMPRIQEFWEFVLNNHIEHHYSKSIYLSTTKIASFLSKNAIRKAKYSDLNDLYYFYVKEIEKYNPRKSRKEIASEVKIALTDAFLDGSIYFVRDTYKSIVAAFLFIVDNIDGLYAICISDLAVKYKSGIYGVAVLLDKFIDMFFESTQFYGDPIILQCNNAFTYAIHCLGLVCSNKYLVTKSTYVGIVSKLSDGEDVPIERFLDDINRVDLRGTSNGYQEWLKSALGVGSSKKGR